MLAQIFGLGQAVFLQQLHFWLKHKSKNHTEDDYKKYYHNNKWWNYKVVESKGTKGKAQKTKSWTIELPFLSPSTIRRYVDELTQKGVIITGKFNAHGYGLKQYKKVSDDKRHIGDTNRLVNFETANIKKSANASLRQLEDIKKLLKKKNINSLDRDLRIVIKGRTKYKTLSLKELADKISVSKNALNHRFMKIRKMVEG